MRAIALCVLLPLAAFAQPSSSTPAPAAPPAPEAPRWSIGAGVFSASTTLVGSSAASALFASPSVAAVPGVTASLERRLSDRAWLVVGLSGAITRSSQDLPPGYAGATRDDLNALTLSAGARYVMTPAGAPVDVSGVALVDAGISGGKTGVPEFVNATYQEVVYDTSAWLVGAEFGIAVDRELTSGLSVRIATPLAGVSYAQSEATTSGQPTLHGKDFSARLELAPRVELRLAF